MHLHTTDRFAGGANHMVMMIVLSLHLIPLLSIHEVDFPHDLLLLQKVDLAVDGGFIDLQGASIEGCNQLGGR